MFRPWFLLLLAFSSSIQSSVTEVITAKEENVDVSCENAKETGRGRNLSVKSRRSHSGGWVTSFDSYETIDGSTRKLKFDLEQKVLECEGKEVLHTNGVIGGSKDEDLIFHTRYGENAVVLDDRRTAYIKNVNDCCEAYLFTNRPLKPNEMFEVKVDNFSDYWVGSLSIGLTSMDPKDFVSAAVMNEMTSGVWEMYADMVFIEEKNVTYGRDLNELKAGDIVGVMRKSNGDLHKYVNRIDQGVAAKHIPYFVYGFLDLRVPVLQATILNDDPSTYTIY